MIKKINKFVDLSIIASIIFTIIGLCLIIFPDVSLNIMSYVIGGRALIREDFYAWQYGPVIPKVYFEYNGYIGNPIRIRYNIDAIDDGDIEIIDYVIDRLKQYRDSVLVDLSHEDDGPWYRHRLDRSIIKKEEIEEYFMGLQNGNR